MKLKYLLLQLLLFVAPACAEQKAACTDVPVFANKFQAVVQTVGHTPGDYRIIDLAKMTGLAWDSLYYFYDDSDNNTQDVISYVTGCPWNGPTFRDDCMRLVFTHKGQISAFVDYIDRDKSREGHFPLPLRVFFGRRSGLVCSFDSARLAIVRNCDEQGVARTFALMREKNAERNRQRIIENCQQKPIGAN